MKRALITGQFLGLTAVSIHHYNRPSELYHIECPELHCIWTVQMNTENLYATHKYEESSF